MNETLENIMVFINENTNILIGICLFLIFVLVAYLIDNSIKSRKAKKEFKKSQMKNELNVENNIKAEKKNKNIKPDKNLESNLFENSISTPEIDINLQTNDSINSVKVPSDNEFQEALMDSAKKDQSIESSDLKDVIGAIDTINTETQNIDLSSEESGAKADVLYKNDKKLSEILFNDVSKEEQSKNIDLNDISKNTIDSNIFNDKKIVSENVDPKKVESKVEIELDENELDNIMKKLKNLSSVDEDDNYTNIF